MKINVHKNVDQQFDVHFFFLFDRWNGYGNDLYTVPEQHTRRPITKGPLPKTLISLHNWVKTNNPSKLQKGDVVEAIPVAGGPLQLIAVQENDPFLCRIIKVVYKFQLFIINCSS